MCDKKYANNNRKNFGKNAIHKSTKGANTLCTLLPNKLITQHKKVKVFLLQAGLWPRGWVEV